jgi:hypothetical protein
MPESFLSTWRSGITPEGLGARVALLHQQRAHRSAPVKPLSGLVTPPIRRRAPIWAHDGDGEGKEAVGACVDQAKNAPISAPTDASCATNKSPA